MATEQARIRTETVPVPTIRRSGLDHFLGRDWKAAWLFFAPTLILLFLLDAWPFLQGVYVSFTKTIGSTLTIGPWIGLANYGALLHDADFLSALGLTVKFTFWAEVFKLSLGIMAALLIHNSRRWRSLWAALILLPWIVPQVVQALVWLALYDPLFGGFDTILGFFHIGSPNFAFLGNPASALWAVIVVNVWAGIPFFTITQLAGLKSIDAEQYDAAAIDGANAWHRFRYITIPGLRYTIIVAELLSWIATMNNFGAIYLMTSGGPLDATRVVGILVYERAFNALNFGSGVAMALFLVPVFGFFIWLLGSYLRSDTKADPSENKKVRLLSLALRPVAWLINTLLDGGEVALGSIPRLIRLVTQPAPGQALVGARAARRAGTIAAGTLLTLLLLFELLPFYWMIVTSFKTDGQIQQALSLFWPAPWTMHQINSLLFETDFLHWFLNTIQVAVVSVFIGVLASAAGAYALARLRWRGSSFFATMLLLTYMMPGVAMLIPLYQIMSLLHLVNTLQALMLAYPSFTLPFACWLLMSYYRSIPEELEDAAMIDGATRAQTFFRLILPLSKPALFAVTLFAITGAWNEFFLAYILLQSSKVLTLPVGMAQMIFGDTYPQGQLMAASLMMAIPVVVIYGLAQRYMVGGLTAGSVKG
ncbi:MAG TPA: ABC transporter permease subunit [Chloroflexota bacterium]